MTTTVPSFYVIVPVFNEAGNLETLFDSFRSLTQEFASKYCVKIVLVDDGSDDGTPSLAQRLAADMDFVLLTHAVNQGPGRAFGTAFQYLAPCLVNDDWIVTLEGDNTSRTELLRQMFQ